MAFPFAFKTDPLQIKDNSKVVGRAYRESGVYQWVREILDNANAAGATDIQFSYEPQFWAKHHAAKMMVSDNGSGIPSIHLASRIQKIGGSGKRTGGLHENFGIGLKTSTLPWNQLGIVVISWVDGEASMLQVVLGDNNDFGLRYWDCEDDDGVMVQDTVITPGYDPIFDINWAEVKPSNIKDNGTAIILLGNTLDQHTILGDPDRKEEAIGGIRRYLNQRFWELPAKTTVVEHRTTEEFWPDDLRNRNDPEKQGWFCPRQAIGAKANILFPKEDRRSDSGKDIGNIKLTGTVALKDGTEVDYYLWEGKRAASVNRFFSSKSFIAIHYQGELYSIDESLATYRAFGICEATVRDNLTLIIRPPLAEDICSYGIYSRGDRNGLLFVNGKGVSGKTLPVREAWAIDFCDNIPEALTKEMQAQQQKVGGTVTGDWRKALAARFGNRFTTKGWVLSRDGHRNATPTGEELTTQGGGGGGTTTDEDKKKKPPRTKTYHLKPGAKLDPGGDKKAKKLKCHRDVPPFRVVGSDDLEAGCAVGWQIKSNAHPFGCVLLNSSHPILQEVVTHWQKKFPSHLAEDVRDEIIQVYGESMCAKVAHMQSLRSKIPKPVMQEKMLSDYALTVGLLGLIGEHAVITARMKKKFGKQRNPAETTAQQSEDSDDGSSGSRGVAATPRKG